MNRSVVLLSGGMDSTVNFLAVREQSEVVLALTFDYGQRAASKEKEVTAQITSHFKVPHQIIELPFFQNFGTSSLIDTGKQVPTGSAVSIDDLKTSLVSAKSVWVPNRNGIFLNVAAGFAESLNANWIVPGFNSEEATTFPDNSKDFLQASTKALSYSTSNQVQVHCLTTDLSKTEIVTLGQKLKMDWKEYGGQANI
jgi:7-cyano-7-deazaguanine synthase